MTIKEEILKKTTAHGQIQDFVEADGFSQKNFSSYFGHYKY